jgi:sugar O-acyltransferase (sialic acid O-acetyltransferase NeuD family)
MAPELIVLVGAGGHAVACIDVVEQHGGFQVAGLIGTAAEVGTSVLGHPVLGSDEQLADLAARYRNALVAVGHIKTSEPRTRLFATLVELGYALPVIVSPRAYVSRHASVGSGTIVMHGAVVNAGARVGRNCILNSMSLVEHDAVIGDHCHLATAASVNGGAAVGARSFVGSHSSIREQVRIGDDCLIGMGCRVLHDCAAGTRVTGQGVRS